MRHCGAWPYRTRAPSGLGFQGSRVQFLGSLVPWFAGRGFHGSVSQASLPCLDLGAEQKANESKLRGENVDRYPRLYIWPEDVEARQWDY